MKIMPKVLRIAYLLKHVWAWIVRPVQLGVRIILLQDGKVLLVRHTYSDGWHFPGGGMKRGESTLEAAAREAHEEAGVDLLEPPRLLGIFSSYSGGTSDHSVVYFSSSFRVGRATDRWEIAECKFFAVDALPGQLGDRWRKVVYELDKAREARNSDEKV